MDYFDISEDVLLVIDKVDASSTATFGDFPAILLKEFKLALAKLLQILFQSVFANGKPLSKLMAIICSIHTGGSIQLLKIIGLSLTSHISKCIERLVIRKLITFVEEKGLLSNF